MSITSTNIIFKHHGQGCLTSAGKEDQTLIKALIHRMGWEKKEGFELSTTSSNLNPFVRALFSGRLLPNQKITITIEQKVRRFSESPLLDLPDELLMFILEKLPTDARLKAAWTCPRLYGLTQDRIFWRNPCFPDKITFEKLTALLIAHGEHIRKLNLAGILSSWSPDNRKTLLIQLSLYCPQLTHIDLSLNRIDVNETIALAEQLPPLQSLRHLDLANNYMGDDGTIALAEQFPHIQSLEYLDLSNNNIATPGVAVLAGQFPHVKSLTHLDLASNTFGPEGAAVLVEQFLYLQSLKHLDLTDNNICNEGASALAEQFPHLKHLKYLDLKENSISLQGAAALAQQLPHLKSLKYFDLKWNLIDLEGSETLIKQFPQLEGVVRFE